MNLSDNLKRLRKENNLSQEELAEKLGVSRQSVSKWESNAAYPEMDKLIQISNMFNVGIDELLNKDIREVREEVQSKNTINKYVNDSLNFITKSIDMFLNMKFKGKIKFLFEQCFIAFILALLFSILGSILDDVFYSIFSFVDWNIIHSVRNVFAGVYYIVAICLGVVIMLHIYKTRYLDYYVVVDKDELNNEENKNLIINDKKKEKIIIRDPDHSSSRFINGLVKVFLIVLKINAIFLFGGVALTLIGLACAFIVSFLISKTGLFFVGILLGIISSIIICFIILDLLFNFIVNHKPKFKILFVIFFISIILCGFGFGAASVGFSKFTIEVDGSQTYEETIPMSGDLIIHQLNADNYEFIESDNSDVKLVIDYSKGIKPMIEREDNLLRIYTVNDYSPMEEIRYVIDKLNEHIVIDNNYHEVFIYTNKDNINKLQENFERWQER